MKNLLLLLMCVLTLPLFAQESRQFFAANDSLMQYTGRIDFSNPLLPRFWQPGVYIQFRFEGNGCQLILQDEELWGKNHNYLELVVDGKASRLQTTSKRDTIDLETGAGIHDVLVCKNTEANIGYLEWVGVNCHRLLPLPAKPIRKMEFIGNSITCGASADVSAVPCHQGQWQDQHNAYLSYGAVTARSLQAQYHLSSVSGIGLMHSCCNLEIVMPQVFDKMSMRNNQIVWDFNRYQPDVVTVCLGQNDGIQPLDSFCINYHAFLVRLRQYYPKARIICLTSPMADDALRHFMRTAIERVLQQRWNEGDRQITSFVFERAYTSGCDYHPDVNEHAEIANALTAFIKKTMGW